MSGKTRGRKNQRAELRKTTNKRLLSLYGSELSASSAVEVLETYHQCLNAGLYGGIADLEIYSNELIEQMSVNGDPRKMEIFHSLVIAPIWDALCKSDSQFFMELGRALELLKTNEKELSHHHRLLEHLDDPKNAGFKYSHEKIIDIVDSVGGEVNVDRLLKDLDLTLIKGRIVEGLSAEKKKQMKLMLRKLSLEGKREWEAEIAGAEGGNHTRV